MITVTKSKGERERERERELISTFPRRISLRKGPYMSEVSRKVTPVWMAWWMREIMSCSGFGGPYKADMPMHPKPCADTSSPCEPSFILPIPAEAIFLQQPLLVLAAEWMDECVSSLCLLYLNSSIHNHPGWIWVALFIYLFTFWILLQLWNCCRA